MPGPPPKKNARRRNARPDWVKLPAGGRTGDPPAFPIAPPVDTNPETGETRQAEHPEGLDALWAELWSSPQAVQWDALGWTRVVARYALLVLASERPRASGKTLEEVRHLEDRLGLSPMAMKRLQWEVGPSAGNDEAAPEDGSNVVDLVARMG